MRAGLLKEIIGILELRTTYTETGAERREYVPTQHIRAWRKKLSAAFGNGVNASEEFIGSTLVFQVRAYSFLNENVRIQYGQNQYKIISLDHQLDHTYLITCTKINE